MWYGGPPHKRSSCLGYTDPYEWIGDHPRKSGYSIYTTTLEHGASGLCKRKDLYKAQSEAELSPVLRFFLQQLAWVIIHFWRNQSLGSILAAQVRCVQFYCAIAYCISTSHVRDIIHSTPQENVVYRTCCILGYSFAVHR